jgi:hypothetical protein
MILPCNWLWNCGRGEAPIKIRFKRGKSRKDLIRIIEDRQLVAVGVFGDVLVEEKVQSWLKKASKKTMLKALIMTGLMPVTSGLSLACGDLVEGFLEDLSVEDCKRIGEKVGKEIATKITDVLSKRIVDTVVDKYSRNTDQFYDDIRTDFAVAAQDLRENLHKMTDTELLLLYNLYDAKTATNAFFKERIRAMRREHDLVSMCGYDALSTYRWVGVVQPPDGQAQKVVVFCTPRLEAKHVVAGVFFGAPGLAASCLLIKSGTYVEHVLENEIVKERARSSKYWRDDVVKDFVVHYNCPWKPKGVNVRRMGGL